MIYSKHFGWGVQSRLQKRIQERHHGELLVGLADVVQTENSQIPYCIAAPTMRVPMILSETPNAYLAARAVFLLLQHGKFDDGHGDLAGKNNNKPSFSLSFLSLFIGFVSFGSLTWNSHARCCVAGKPVSEVIRSVAFPGLGTGVGRVSPESCARQMRQAIVDHVLGEYKFPQTWSEAQVCVCAVVAVLRCGCGWGVSLVLSIVCCYLAELLLMLGCVS